MLSLEGVTAAYTAHRSAAHTAHCVYDHHTKSIDDNDDDNDDDDEKPKPNDEDAAVLSP